MPIPEDLYDFLLEQRMIFNLEKEKCSDGAHQNCFRINEKGKRVDDPKTKVEKLSPAQMLKPI